MSGKKKKKLRIGRIILAIVCVFIVGIGIVYFMGMNYYNTHFLNGTVINGIDVSGMTIDELDDTIKHYTLAVKEKGINEGEEYVESITGKDIGIKILSSAGINEIMENQNKMLWFTDAGEEYSKDRIIEYDEQMLSEKIDTLKCLDPDYAQSPTNAYISEYKSGVGYEIVPAVDGNLIVKEKAMEAIDEAITGLESEVSLLDDEYYEEPKVKSDDEKLNSALNKMNKLVGVKIVYTFGENKETVDGDLISEWITYKKGKVKFDRANVDEYVATLRKKYDTIFRDRTFETTSGKQVTIEGGDYGWWMNYVQEAKELGDMIENGESGERTPVYYQTAAQYGKSDIGDTYVEINLTAQHLYVYKDGNMVLDSDFVSGNTGRKMGTPEGVYGITYKERYGVLVGETYESTVAYWMPFNGDIGLHDAIWKTQFGSDFYKTDGSHGCINLPYGIARKIYAIVEYNTPVVCYKLKGTDSDSVTVQSYEEIAEAAIEAIDAIGEVDKDSEDEIETAKYMYNKIGAQAREYVTNYDVLVKAEKEFKKIKK